MEILDRGDIDVARMRGSWAGAMGQPQFMPSSYLKWAEDFDEDGRTDIWSSPPDVFASIANYMKAHGWKAGQTWGREVKISRAVAKTIANDVERRNGSCVARRDMTVALPMARWQELGVRLTNGPRCRRRISPRRSSPVRPEASSSTTTTTRCSAAQRGAHSDKVANPDPSLT